MSKKIFHHSKESKIKMRLAHLGKKHSEAHIKATSLGHIGIRQTEESKSKIGKSLKGHVVSKETRRKISEAQKGIPCPQRGKEWTEEQRKKISKSLKETYSKIPKEVLSERARKTHTPESRAKRIKSQREHKQKILEYAEKFRSEGYEVVTEFDVRPDIIIRKGNKITAVEIQRGKKKDGYGDQKVFDKVKWIYI